MDWSKKQRFVIRSIQHSNAEHDSKSGSVKSKGSSYHQSSGRRMEEDYDAQNGGGGAMAVSGSAECSMCGDVGLARNLFRCSRCNSRYQHTYCSNWYPHERSIYIEVCNWCAAEAMMVKSGGATLGGSQDHDQFQPQFQHQHQRQHQHQHQHQHQLQHQHQHQHHHHHLAKHGDGKEEGGEEEDKDGGGATMAVAEHHHHHRLIKKTSKRLVVRRYKFVSEV